MNIEGNAFLKNLGIWASIVVAVFTIIDWLLLESQKNYIRVKLETIRNWMSKQRNESFVKMIKGRYFYWISWAYVSLSMFWFILSPIHRNELTGEYAFITGRDLAVKGIYPYPIKIDIIILLISLFICYRYLYFKMFKKIFCDNSLPKYFARLLFCFILFLVPYFLFILSSAFVTNKIAKHNYVHDTDIPYVLPYYDGTNKDGTSRIVTPPGPKVSLVVNTRTAFIAETVYSAFYIPVNTVLVLLTSVFTALTIWSVVSSSAILFLRLCQFILYRIIENRNGPVLGISVLIIILGLLS